MWFLLCSALGQQRELEDSQHHHTYAGVQTILINVKQRVTLEGFFYHCNITTLQQHVKGEHGSKPEKTFSTWMNELPIALPSIKGRTEYMGRKEKEKTLKVCGVHQWIKTQSMDCLGVHNIRVFKNIYQCAVCVHCVLAIATEWLPLLEKNTFLGCICPPPTHAEIDWHKLALLL